MAIIPGDKVLILSSGGRERIRHYIKVGEIAEVLYNRNYGSNYELKGANEQGNCTVQTVNVLDFIPLTKASNRNFLPLLKKGIPR